MKQLAAALASWSSPFTLKAIQPSRFVMPGTLDSLALRLILLSIRSFGKFSYSSMMVSIISSALFAVIALGGFELVSLTHCSGVSVYIVQGDHHDLHRSSNRQTRPS